MNPRLTPGATPRMTVRLETEPLFVSYEIQQRLAGGDSVLNYVLEQVLNNQPIEDPALDPPAILQALVRLRQGLEGELTAVKQKMSRAHAALRDRDGEDQGGYENAMAELEAERGPLIALMNKVKLRAADVRKAIEAAGAVESQEALRAIVREELEKAIEPVLLKLNCLRWQTSR